MSTKERSRISIEPIRYNLIKDLSKERQDWTLKVKVTRMRDAINPKTNNFIGVEIILADEEGVHIQDSIRGDDASDYKRTLKEGNIYITRNFNVTANKEEYRTVTNKHIIYLNFSTSVQTLDEDEPKIPRHKFELGDYELIQKPCDSIVQLTDIIGQLRAIDRLTQRARTVLREITLEHTSGQNFVVTLWGEIGKTFSDHLNLDDSVPIVRVNI